MNMLMIMGIGIAGLSIIFGIGYYFFNKNENKYTFIKLNKDLSGFHILKGKIEVDKNNAKIERFKIEDYSKRLDKRSPNFFYNGKGVWSITTDDNGDLIYIDPKEEILIDKEKYFKFQLMPEERSAEANAIKDFNKLFAPENNMMKGAFIGMLIFFILGAIFSAYVAYHQVSISANFQESTANTYKSNELVFKTVNKMDLIISKMYEDFPDEFKNRTITIETRPNS